MGEDQLRRQVLLVVLHDERHRAHIDAVLEQVALEVLQTLDVLIELPGLAVAYEHHAIRTLQHESSRRVVVDLARHGVELEPGGEARDLAQVDRQEIEEEGAIGLRRERHHPAAPRFRDPSIDVMEIRRLPGPSRSVVDDFARDLAAREVDQGHFYLPNSVLRLSVSSRSKSAANTCFGTVPLGVAAFKSAASCS